MQLEAVGVQVSRKLAAESFQRGTIQCDGCDELVLGRGGKRLAEEVDHRAVALVVDVVRVATDAIEAQSKSQVLDSARPQHRLPAAACDVINDSALKRRSRPVVSALPLAPWKKSLSGAGVR